MNGICVRGDGEAVYTWKWFADGRVLVEGRKIIWGEWNEVVSVAVIIT